MYLDVIKTYWKESLAYRAEFMISIITVPLRFLVYALIWSSVFSVTSTVSGYTYEAMMQYVIISTIVSIIIYDTITSELQFDIRTGNFLVNLIKPFSYPFYGLIKKLANRAFAVIVEIIPILIIFVLFFKEFLVIGNFFVWSISMMLSFVISYTIYLMLGALAFWFTRVRSFSWMVNFFINLASGLLIPLDLFPGAVKSILLFLPFRYLSYVPASIYLGRISGAEIVYALLTQAIWLIALIFLSGFVWKRAIKRFSGVGT